MPMIGPIYAKETRITLRCIRLHFLYYSEAKIIICNYKGLSLKYYRRNIALSDFWVQKRNLGTNKHDKHSQYGVILASLLYNYNK